MTCYQVTIVPKQLTDTEKLTKLLDSILRLRSTENAYGVCSQRADEHRDSLFALADKFNNGNIEPEIIVFNLSAAEHALIASLYRSNAELAARKVTAIKFLREQHAPLTLRDAKDICDMIGLTPDHHIVPFNAITITKIG